LRLVLWSLFLFIVAGSARAQNLLTNGNLDVTYQQEIVPGFFLPKPSAWANVGTRTISGPYEDEMSSEVFAGGAPTPATHDGVTPPPEGSDWGVFFKPFSGNATDGPATGHLYQDVAGTAGKTYTLTGWAGAEANALMANAEIAIEFRNAGGLISTTSASLLPTLFVPNGQPFNYKLYSLSGLAPAGTTTVRARVSMIDSLGNPAGGGQAFVVDDFTLSVPEPASLSLVSIGVLGLAARRRQRSN